MNLIKVVGVFLCVVLSQDARSNDCSRLFELAKSFEQSSFEVINKGDGFVISSNNPSILITCSSALGMDFFKIGDVDENGIVDVHDKGRPVYIRIGGSVSLYASPSGSELQDLSACEYFHRYPVINSSSGAYYYEFIDEKENTSISVISSKLELATSFIEFLGYKIDLNIEGALKEICGK